MDNFVHPDDGKPMRYWYVQFAGMYLGGHAIIPAVTSEGAVDVLTNDDRYTSLCEDDRAIDSVTEVVPPILYFWNGDY